MIAKIEKDLCLHIYAENPTETLAMPSVVKVNDTSKMIFHIHPWIEQDQELQRERELEQEQEQEQERERQRERERQQERQRELDSIF